MDPHLDNPPCLCHVFPQTVFPLIPSVSSLSFLLQIEDSFSLFLAFLLFDLWWPFFSQFLTFHCGFRKWLVITPPSSFQLFDFFFHGFLVFFFPIAFSEILPLPLSPTPIVV